MSAGRLLRSLVASKAKKLARLLLQRHIREACEAGSSCTDQPLDQRQGLLLPQGGFGGPTVDRPAEHGL